MTDPGQPANPYEWPAGGPGAQPGNEPAPGYPGSGPAQPPTYWTSGQQTPPGYPAQPGQQPYQAQHGGQQPGQPPYQGQPGQPPYASQPPYQGQPPYPGQPGQPPYQQMPGTQPPAGTWQPGAGGYQSDWATAAYPGAPGMPGAPAPRRGLRVGLIVGIAVLAILLVGGGVTAIALSGNTSKHPAATGTSGTGATPTAASTSDATATGSLTLTAPDRIGALRKMADQSRANTMKSAMSLSGVEQPFAAIYEDPATAGREVIIWGGVGGAFGGSSPQGALDQFFSASSRSLGTGVTVGTRINANPGPAGGKAQCGKVNGLGIRMALCGWAGDNAAVGIIFTALTPEQAGAQVHTLLAAVVAKK